MAAKSAGERRAIPPFTFQSPWLDLVNSQSWDGFGGFTDLLFDEAWIARFVRRWGFHAKGQGAASARSQLTRLRGLLRTLAETVAGGESLNPDEIDRLNDFLRAPAYLTLVAAKGGFDTEPVPVRRNWGWIRSRIAAAWTEDLVKRPKRIKICGNIQCRWVFVDGTKGNIRRWCKDQRCGNRHRVRRARARHR